MTLLRDSDDFTGVIDIAADRLGLSRAFVEKDYWVTQVLHALKETQDNDFVLKGGTSLSKGYGLIDRFSEDVDILFVPEHGQSVKTVERRLERAASDVAEALRLECDMDPRPGRGKNASRGDFIRYKNTSGAFPDMPIAIDTVLLETKVGVGHEPSQMVTIQPLVVSRFVFDFYSTPGARHLGAPLRSPQSLSLLVGLRGVRLSRTGSLRSRR